MPINTFCYTKQQIAAIERLAVDQHGLSTERLMQYAAEAGFNLLKNTWPSARNIVVVCGQGNNAGDGYTLAWLAKKAGLQVRIAFLISPAELTGAAKAAAEMCQDAGIEAQQFEPKILSNAEVIVDALFGTGIARSVTGQWKDAVVAINQSEKPVLSIDVPSGVDADTGCAFDVAVEADVTITFIGLKQGLLSGHGPAYSGAIVVDRLKIPEDAFTEILPSGQCLTAARINPLLAKRRRDVYKNMFGHVLVIGGDYGMAGAVRMAAEAAARVGAGLVSVATRPEHASIISSARPEIMCHDVQSGIDLHPLIANASVLVVGPGLGKGRWGRELLNTALHGGKPLIIDADGLNLLPDSLRQPNDHWILTPHPGEAARLLRIPTARIQAQRWEAIHLLQQQYGGVSVLKGAGTLIKGSEPIPDVCMAGNPGMASGGMGDVLSGVLGGLLAQGYSPLNAARIGVFLHSSAADLAVLDHGERGLMAMDLMVHLRKLANPV